MVISNIEQIKIAGIAAAVSNTWTAIETFSETEGESMVKRFVRQTGVKGRYDAGIKQTTSDFCFAAAQRLLAEKGIAPKEIGALVFVTQTPDYRIPATACVLQNRLGLSNDCIAFDVNLGCSGFTYGLNIVASLMQTANIAKALLLAGDTSAKERSQLRKEKTTHSASMLFGDSGTATLLEKDQSYDRKMNMISKTDGSGYKAIISPYEMWRNPDQCGGTQMDDIEVFNFAVSKVPIILKETMDLSRASPNDYECLVLHQTNLFMMKQIAKRSGFEMKKTLVSLDVFGNTSSSSIPISLVKEYGACETDKEIRALMCGFGVGLSWSTVDAYINIKDVLPLIHTDDYFEDGYGEESKK